MLHSAYKLTFSVLLIISLAVGESFRLVHDGLEHSSPDYGHRLNATYNVIPSFPDRTHESHRPLIQFNNSTIEKSNRSSQNSVEHPHDEQDEKNGHHVPIGKTHQRPVR